MLSDEELEKRIKKANDKFISEADDGQDTTFGEAEAFVDIYQNGANKVREESKKIRPNGSSTLVKAVTRAVVDGDGAEGLAHAHKRAKDDSDIYRRRGERDRAEVAKQQYMEEHFLPAVETVISYTSPDELLNCKEALSALDKYVFGTGDSTGYTASYVRSAYKDLLGQDLDGRFDQSDPAVTDAVRRIRFLANRDDIRTAIGLAKRIKKQIDDGEHLASDADYSLIGRLVAYAS